MLRIRKTHKGGILIEFTFSIPICIALLFFVNDHYRLYELNNKIKSSTYLAASMIQQITNTRSDKQIGRSDIKRITYASCLNFFHTNSMFYPYPFGICYGIELSYIKRVSNDSYQYQRTYSGTYATSTFKDMPITAMQTLKRTQAQVEAIHPDLVCQKDGEELVLIECYYSKNHFSKSKLGFFLIDPPTVKNSAGSNCLCLSKLIITPKPGLFPVNFVN